MRFGWFAVLVFAVIASACGSDGSNTTPVVANNGQASPEDVLNANDDLTGEWKVLEVVDGATLKLQQETRTIDAKLLCVSAEAPGTEKGDIAARRLKFNVMNWGSKVVLERDEKAPLKDDAGKYYCYVFGASRQEGYEQKFFANYDLISSGSADFIASTDWPSKYRKWFRAALIGNFKSALSVMGTLFQDTADLVQLAAEQGMDDVQAQNMLEGLEQMRSGIAKMLKGADKMTAEEAKSLAESSFFKMDLMTIAGTWSATAESETDSKLKSTYLKLASKNEFAAEQQARLLQASLGLAQLP